MGEIRPSERTAKKVETKTPVPVEKLPTKQLAKMLNEQYAVLIQTQQNIQIINRELEKRET